MYQNSWRHRDHGGRKQRHSAQRHSALYDKKTLKPKYHNSKIARISRTNHLEDIKRQKNLTRNNKSHTVLPPPICISSQSHWWFLQGWMNMCNKDKHSTVTPYDRIRNLLNTLIWCNHGTLIRTIIHSHYSSMIRFCTFENKDSTSEITSETTQRSRLPNTNFEMFLFAGC